MTPVSLHSCILMEVRAKRKTVTNPSNSNFGISTSPYAACRLALSRFFSPAQIVLCIPQLPSELTCFTRTVCPLQDWVQWCVWSCLITSQLGPTSGRQRVFVRCTASVERQDFSPISAVSETGCKQTRPLGSVCYPYSCLPMPWY